MATSRAAILMAILLVVASFTSGLSAAQESPECAAVNDKADNGQLLSPEDIQLISTCPPRIRNHLDEIALPGPPPLSIDVDPYKVMIEKVF